jgi:hypothetical protein
MLKARPFDRLAANEDVRLSVRIANLEDFRELPKRKARGYFHLAMARATWFKLVIRHLAPSPTSEARRCRAVVAAGLRQALRAAAMRLCASCRFTSLKSTVFTQAMFTASVRQKQAARNGRFGDREAWPASGSNEKGRAVDSRGLLSKRILVHFVPVCHR